MGNCINYVMTLANSIIGVGVLAMPFCFQKCGIILAIIMILLSSIISRLSCHFLLKASIYSRRKNFEFLAFHALGSTGKLLVELGIIGFLMGTVIAFFVVVGDLGPEIIAKALNIESSQSLRSWLLILITIGCVIPLGLLRNVDSLSSICTVTIGFYICLVIKVMLESTQHISDSDWFDKVELWNPSGILQCLPIFSMALFCQTQIFEIYSRMENASLEKMNLVVKWAINICSMVYILVGSFGYIAFCHQHFGGNILLSFSPTPMSDIIKMGFVLSVAFSFPLAIFPCRSSLYSLLFRRVTSQHEVLPTVMPERRFRCLTIFIVAVGLAVAMAIPSIELVLGLVGSTMGVAVCVLLPAACYVKVVTKQTNERLLAQIVLVTGVLIMIFGTYANLYAMDEAASINSEDSIVKNEIVLVPLDEVKMKLDEKSTINKNSEVILNDEKIDRLLKPDNKIIKTLPKDQIIESPPLPVEKDELVQVVELIKEATVKKEEEISNVKTLYEVKPIETKRTDNNEDTAIKLGIDKVPNEISVDAIKKEDHEISLEKNNLLESTKLMVEGKSKIDIKSSKEDKEIINKGDNKLKSEVITEAIIIEKIKKEKQQLDDEFESKIVLNSNLLVNMNIKNIQTSKDDKIEKNDSKIKTNNLNSVVKEPMQDKKKSDDVVQNDIEKKRVVDKKIDTSIQNNSPKISKDVESNINNVAKAVPIASHIKKVESDQKVMQLELNKKRIDSEMNMKINLTKPIQEVSIALLNNNTKQKVENEISHFDKNKDHYDRLKRDTYHTEKDENCQKNENNNVHNEINTKLVSGINILNSENTLKDSLFLEVLKPSIRDLKSIEDNSKK